MIAPVVVVASIASASHSASHADAVLADVNDARAQRGLRPLVLDPRLCAVAREHGNDMAARKYFEHDTPEGLTPFDRLSRAHVRFQYAAENLALAPDVASADRLLLASPEHRENVLGAQYTRVGIATIDSLQGELLVEDFSD